MDSHVKRRLVWSFLSSWVARISSTVIQLVQLPVFLHYWTMPLYGDWLIVSAVPTYLSFSTTRFGTVAGNQMTMMVARADPARALAAPLLAIPNTAEGDTKWIVFYLGVSVLLGQLEQLLQSAYRSIMRYAYGTFVKTLMSLTAFALTLVAVVLHQGPRTIALVYACANVAGTIFLALLVKRDIRWIEFGWSHASAAKMRTMVRPALAFMCLDR